MFSKKRSNILVPLYSLIVLHVWSGGPKRRGHARGYRRDSRRAAQTAAACGRRRSAEAAQQHCGTAAASMLRDSETEAQLRLVEGSLVRRRCGACRGESASVTIAQSRSAHSSTRSHETVRGTSAARGPVRGSGADRASFLSSIRDRERLRALRPTPISYCKTG